MSKRTFELQPAIRERVPLLVGLVGPSGSGKTYSALELATGMQEALKDTSPGPIIFIDTENRRSLHYADNFDFQHLGLGAPFGSLDYLSAIEYAASQKPSVIVVDSMSHEHEGPGGLIDFHAKEVERMAGNDYAKQQRVQMLAWQKPKANRRAFLNGIVRLNTNIIMCFRAGEKSKPVRNQKGKQEIVAQGFTPIAAPEFVYEMTLSALLYPGAKGVPTWESDKPGEHGATKLPGQFYNMFREVAPLSREHGKKLAEWAQGGSKPAGKVESIDIDALKAEGDKMAGLGMSFLGEFWGRLVPAQQHALKDSKDGWKLIAEAADKAPQDQEAIEGVEL